MLSPFSTAFAIPRINQLTLLSSRAQPGSPTRASRARALARKKVACAGGASEGSAVSFCRHRDAPEASAPRDVLRLVSLVGRPTESPLAQRSWAKTQ
jgi:hypothetical protein